MSFARITIDVFNMIRGGHLGPMSVHYWAAVRLRLQESNSCRPFGLERLTPLTLVGPCAAVRSAQGYSCDEPFGPRKDVLDRVDQIGAVDSRPASGQP